MKIKKIFILSKLLVIFLMINLSISVILYCFLSKTDQPTKTDAIILIEGGDVNRYRTAASLYRKGYAKKIIVSPTIENINGLNNLKVMIKLGVKEKDIIKDKGPTTSTWKNALNCIELLKKNNFNSAIIVTSDYHIARTHLSFDREKEKTMNLYYIGSKSKNGKFWYQEYNGIKQTIREILVLPIYLLELYKFDFFDR